MIYEALRLWPPVPFDLKMAFEDDVLPGGWKVPKMAQVAFIPYIMGRDGERYPEPLLFKPERWIPFNAPPQHEFPVFQAGPRICLGMDMALWHKKLKSYGVIKKEKDEKGLFFFFHSPWARAPSCPSRWRRHFKRVWPNTEDHHLLSVATS